MRFVLERHCCPARTKEVRIPDQLVIKKESVYQVSHESQGGDLGGVGYANESVERQPLKFLVS